MLIGHYGFAFGLKSLRREVPLWLLVAAVVLVDIAHYILLLAGVERFVVDLTFTQWIRTRPVYYGISHGLLGILVVSLLAVPAAIIVAKRSVGRITARAAALVLWLAVLSHALADFLTHPGTMPLACEGSPTVGLGLWNYPVVSNALELGLYFGGLFLFVRGAAPLSTRAKAVLAVLTVALTGFHLSVGFTPPVADPVLTGVTMLVTMGAVIGAAAIVDRG